MFVYYTRVNLNQIKIDIQYFIKFSVNALKPQSHLKQLT